MKMSSLARPLAVLGALLLGGPVLAQDVPMAEDNSNAFLAQAKVQPTAPRLSLSDEQRQKIKSLKDQYTLDTAMKKAQLKVQRGQLFDLLRKSKVDKQEVLSLHAKVTALRSELSDARMNFMLAANDVFTPEQKEQMGRRFMTGGSIRGGGHGKRGPCGGGFRGKHGGGFGGGFGRGTGAQTST